MEEELIDNIVGEPVANTEFIYLEVGKFKKVFFKCTAAGQFFLSGKIFKFNKRGTRDV